MPQVAADGAAVQLHKRETSGSGYWGHPGIATVTFCEGDPAAVFSALKVSTGESAQREAEL